MSSCRLIGKIYLTLLIISMLFLVGCSSDLPPWSMHGEETIDNGYLDCSYLIRYQGNNTANDVTVKVQSLNQEISQTYRFVYSGKVINPRFKLPLNNDINASNIKVKIFLDWTDTSGEHSTDLTAP
ncbi:hypothetical protein [Phosphitispora fastidiosa]|uniref:hypothetical protein n=1 Tax=Phosphitispora fastidiosa TaxID=2837202 RepID=UPI001E38F82E|nr:hypothetical protein [Phosphitispora fastidiosa]MBU7008379.1 hypothetical protein [Phosphitispora fastidiosa]